MKFNMPMAVFGGLALIAAIISALEAKPSPLRRYGGRNVGLGADS